MFSDHSWYKLINFDVKKSNFIILSFKTEIKWIVNLLSSDNNVSSSYAGGKLWHLNGVAKM